MSSIATTFMIRKHLTETFGPFAWSEAVVVDMRKRMLKDLMAGKKYEYQSSVGLLNLYERAKGSEFIADMVEVIVRDKSYEKYDSHRVMINLRQRFLEHCDMTTYHHHHHTSHAATDNDISDAAIDTSVFASPAIAVDDGDAVQELKQKAGVKFMQTSNVKIDEFGESLDLYLFCFLFLLHCLLFYWLLALYHPTECRSFNYLSSLVLHSGLPMVESSDSLLDLMDETTPIRRRKQKGGDNSLNMMNALRHQHQYQRSDSYFHVSSSSAAGYSMSYQQFHKIFLSNWMPLHSPRFKEVVKIFDSDGSGTVEWSELQLRARWALAAFDSESQSWSLEHFIQVIFETFVSSRLSQPVGDLHNKQKGNYNGHVSFAWAHTKTITDYHFHLSAESLSSLDDQEDG